MLPAIGTMARELTGSRPSIRNDKAKQVLGWQPRGSWRSPPIPEEAVDLYFRQ
jgi:hypothetical protein